ncbi:DMT family transporter [Mesorhizobium sp. NZP2077]|uniref:DMT family transporter n=1 Tax=Mesorhizobium sp. NZP2077 TaxID=2483404 RepID=UPI001552017C|nr:DMT family transporter [Mesorhizobium sp. NZP2077]QKC82944.1 DMT family transporter [Mesorhizobium sp. NZP2077]QKD16448.1 DMT family transporter [Mesorhizobium sp. NZP2077]
MTTQSNERALPVTGVIVILMTVFAMALTDAFVKFSSANLTLWQIYVLRSVIATPVLLLLTRGAVWPVALGWVALRSVALLLMYLAIYAAIPVLDLSVIAASLYTAPLFIVLLSSLMLGERIARYQWAGIALGLAGVLLIVRPTAVAFSPLPLIPVAAAFLYAIAAIVTRAKCARETPMTMALWLNITLLAAGTIASLVIGFAGPLPAYPFLFGRWAAMGIQEWQTIAILAALIVSVSIGLARAYQSPKPQIVATFDYAYLIFAAFWGYVFFGEVPNLTTIAGMALIALAGVMVLCAVSSASSAGQAGPVRPVNE